MNYSFLYRHRLRAACASFILVALSGQNALAETRSYVISLFVQAAYSQDGDCPKGLNPLPEVYFSEDLKNVGVPPAEIGRIIEGLKGGVATPEARDALVNRGRIDGKPANAYAYPTSVPDKHQPAVEGRYAYGFNLSGKATTPDSFEDPETHEQGVNNNYFKAMGCYLNHRALPPDEPPYWSVSWGILRESMPAWLISISGDDLGKDGNVSVAFQRALEHVWRDANGNVRRNSTFRIDPDPRWHNVLAGKIRNGIVEIAPGEIHLEGDPFMLAQLDLAQAHMRLKLSLDGTAKGILGGYVPWLSLYFIYAGDGFPAETMLGMDVPGVYHSLRRWADAYPDPRTGQNTAISAAFRIEAVPAFAVPMSEVGDNQTLPVSPRLYKLSKKNDPEKADRR